MGWEEAASGAPSADADADVDGDAAARSELGEHVPRIALGAVFL